MSSLRLVLLCACYRVAHADSRLLGAAGQPSACNGVLVTGQKPGMPMAHRMGFYKEMPGMLNGRPTYQMQDSGFGPAFLFYDSIAHASRYWVVGASIGTRDANLAAQDNAKAPQNVGPRTAECAHQPVLTAATVRVQIHEAWHVADPTKGKFGAAPDVKVACSTQAHAHEVLSTATPSSTARKHTHKHLWMRHLICILHAAVCKSILLTGQQADRPMSHRMGVYTLMSQKHSGKPAYKFVSPLYGAAYLYYEQLAASEEYWVVGPALGSTDANLGVASTAEEPDQIRAAWHVADTQKGTFDRTRQISASCATAKPAGARGEPAKPFPLAQQ
jgi:hypothetical protein